MVSNWPSVLHAYNSNSLVSYLQCLYVTASICTHIFIWVLRMLCMLLLSFRHSRFTFQCQLQTAKLYVRNLVQRVLISEGLVVSHLMVGTIYRHVTMRQICRLTGQSYMYRKLFHLIHTWTCEVGGSGGGVCVCVCVYLVTCKLCLLQIVVYTWRYVAWCCSLHPWRRRSWNHPVFHTSSRLCL